MGVELEKEDRSLASFAEVSSIAPLPEAVERQLLSVLEGYLNDLENGHRPDVEKLAAEYPGLAVPLRECLGGIEFLHEAADGLRPERRASRETEPASSKRLGDYEIIREIGRGGMGVVYEARQTSLDRRVALKVLPFSAVLDQKQVARFTNEARAAAHLHHPNIVPVFSVGCERGVHYYTMQYIEGRPLHHAMGQIDEIDGTLTARRGASVDVGPASVECPGTAQRETEKPCLTIRSPRGSRHFRTIAELGIQAAEALHHAHECGIIHRDIKPSNLLLDRQGNLWVADFGLARWCGGNSGLTSTGRLLGTVKYMSPEQASGQGGLIDHRTDVYSLGVTLYELATLREAFPGKDPPRVLRRIAQDDPIPPRRLRPSIPVDLETIVLKAIAKPRERRYGSARELAEDLRRFVNGEPIRARRASLADHVGKWMGRHKTLVRSSIVLMATGVVILTMAALRIASEQSKTRRAWADRGQALQEKGAALHDSETQRRKAESWYAQARHVLDRLAKRHAQRLRDYPEMETIRQELLRDSIQYYQDFLRGAGDEAALRRDLALTWFRLGKLLEEVPSVSEAREAYDRARSLLESWPPSIPRIPRSWQTWPCVATTSAVC